MPQGQLVIGNRFVTSPELDRLREKLESMRQMRDRILAHQWNSYLCCDQPTTL